MAEFERGGSGAWEPAHGTLAPRELAAGPVPPAIIIECPNCGLVQECGQSTANHKISCCRCRTPLAHCAGKSIEAALACSLAILVLLIPAMAEPFLTTTAFGASRTSVLPMSAAVLWREGWPLLAAAVCLFVMVFPLLRFAATTAVLWTLCTPRRPPWLGVVFRASLALQTWAMLDVFLLGLAVAFARLRASLQVTLDVGGMCFIAAALLAMVSRAALDRQAIWRLIAADREPAAGAAALACRCCGLWLAADAAGTRCPRCTAVVRPRRPYSVGRACAALVAAVLLYLPANFYPIATIPIDLTPTAYTVLGGVFDLAGSGLLGLALLVFCASFTIPLLKMVGLSWCIASTLRRSSAHLVAKTRVYRTIEEIGRWSMVDPLTIACFVPVLQFNGLITGRAEPAATPFAAVVILTTFAVKLFDPRLMWDAARRPA